MIVDRRRDRTCNLLIRSQAPCHWASRPISWRDFGFNSLRPLHQIERFTSIKCFCIRHFTLAITRTPILSKPPSYAPSFMTATTSRHCITSNRYNRNQQALKVTRSLSPHPVGQVALVVVLVGGLTLGHAITTPVDHDDATDQGDVLCTSSSHGSFQHVGVMLEKLSAS